MTSQEYNLIAEAIRKSDLAVPHKARLIEELVLAFQRNDSEFDHIKFIRSCGLEVAYYFGLI